MNLNLYVIQEGRYNSEAKDSYQYNIREYNDRVKVSIWKDEF